jgi:LPXTG-motif cell wall-anchored protein
VGTLRRTVLLAASLLVLGLPAAAAAQTPGDEQYTDPFGGGQEEGGSQEPEETPAPAEPSEPAPAAPAPAATQSQPQAQPSAQLQLPRTGADAGWLALSGTLLLAGGIALRVRLSEPPRRRRGHAGRA